MKKLGILLVLSVVGPFACGKKTPESDLSWGHLDDDWLLPSSPHYLINKGPNDSYRVCIPQYMADALPGVEEEVKASINIWAAYLGRSIAVETRIRDLPRAATAQDDLNAMRAKYYSSCGQDVDVVLGFAPFKYSTVGQTGASWMIQNKQVKSFQRHLFLRDYTLTPEDDKTVPRWVSQQELNGKAVDSEELLETMQARSTQQVAPRQGAVALQVLVHEFGHVWGLCDQYKGPSNCDPENRSAPDTHSMMAAASNVAKIYLTDDDITGIRKLAERPGFNAKWPGTEEALGKPANPIALSEITAFKLNSIEKNGTQYTLSFSAVTTKGGELYIDYRLKGSTGNWQTFSTYFPSDRYPETNKPFMIAERSFPFTLRTDGDYEFRLKLRLRGADGTLAAPLYTSLQ